MSAMEPLCHLIGINPSLLTKTENVFLEADLFERICEELMEFFRQQNREYFRSMKFSLKMQNFMLEANFIRLILTDILSTGEYSLKGIAYYTDTHEDVVQDLAAGLNNKPLAAFLRKAIGLHKSVRRDLYETIGKKIATELSNCLSK